jgi:hypothetical protein
MQQFNSARCLPFCSNTGSLVDICRTYLLPIVTIWPGCDVLLLASAVRHFSCKSALLEALFALASWFHVRHSNASVEFPQHFFDCVSGCCALAHDVIFAYNSDSDLICAAGTLLSMFSRDLRTVRHSSSSQPDCNVPSRCTALRVDATQGD